MSQSQLRIQQRSGSIGGAPGAMEQNLATPDEFVRQFGGNRVINRVSVCIQSFCELKRLQQLNFL